MPKLQPNSELGDDGEMLETSMDDLNGSSADPIIVFETADTQKPKPDNLIDIMTTIADQVTDEDLEVLKEILIERLDSLRSGNMVFEHSKIRESVLNKLIPLVVASGVGSFITLAIHGDFKPPTELTTLITIIWFILLSTATYIGVWMHLAGEEKDMITEIFDKIEKEKSLMELDQEEIQYILDLFANPSQQKGFSMKTLATFKDKINPALKDLVHSYRNSHLEG